MENELRKVGDQIFFEYHCKESHDSADAKIWYRSHQMVTITSGPVYDAVPVTDDCFDGEMQMPKTRQGRANEALVLMYKVIFADGLEHDVFEDELLDSTNEYDRPNPPQPS